MKENIEIDPTFCLQIFDGHNGISAAIFAKEHLLGNVLSAIPQGANREKWLQALPRALVAGFVKTDIEFQQKGMWHVFYQRFPFCTFTVFLNTQCPCLLCPYVPLNLNCRGNFWDYCYICCD